MTSEVLAELVRPRTPVDHLRARATTAGAAGTGVFALAAASIAGYHGTSDDASVRGIEAHGLAPFIAQDGLHPGSVTAAALLVLPFAALALQALRVGSLAAERRAALLSLAGATPRDLQRLSTARTRAAFWRGGLLAAPAYLLLWLVLGVALPAGWRLLPTPQAWLIPVWALVAVLLAGLGAALGARGAHRHPDPLQRARGPLAGPPAALAWGTGVAAVAIVVFAGRLPVIGDSELATILTLLVVVALLATSAATLIARRAARTRPTSTTTGRAAGELAASATDDPAGGAGPAAAPRRGARRRPGRRDTALSVLAAAQRRGNPRAAGTVAAVLFVCGLSFGVEAALSASLIGRYSFVDATFYLGGALLAALLGAVASLVALLALALALSDHLLSARRSLASLAAMGTDTSQLLAVQTRALAATAVPAAVAGTLVAGVLYALPATSLDALRGLAAVGIVLATAVVAAGLLTLACRVIAHLLAGRMRAATHLDNLRTP